MDLDGSLAQDIEMLSNAELGLLSSVLTVSYGVKGFCWPWVIPIHSAAVDDTWELSASVSELVTDWGESKADVEVLSADLDEVVVNLISAVTAVGFLCSLGHVIANGNLFIDWEQVWNLTTIKKVVNVFKERFFDDLGIREQEYLWLVVDSRSLEETSDVFVELLFFVTLGDFDGEVLHLVHGSGKSSHGSTARTTDAYQHAVTSLLSEDPGNSTEMLNAVVEEDEVHWGVVGVIELEVLVQSWDKSIDLAQFQVLALWILVVTEEDVLEIFEFPAHIKVLLHALMSHGAVFVSIVLVDKSISEYSKCLMNPEINKKGLIGEVLQTNHKHTLDDLGEISQVESVVALSWGWQEVVDGLLIELDGALDDWLSEDVEA